MTFRGVMTPRPQGICVPSVVGGTSPSRETTIISLVGGTSPSREEIIPLAVVPPESWRSIYSMR